MLRYAITDRHIFSGDEAARRDALLTQVRRLAGSGVHYLQVRERDLPAHHLELLTRHIAHAARPRADDVETPASTNPGAPLRILLNGPAHAAVQAGAHGVHLRGGAGERELAAVHQVFHVAGLPPPVVSLSCHSPDEVRSAAAAGFDLVLFGPIFDKTVRGTRIAPGLGLDQLRHAAEHVVTSPTRLLALGGITPQTALQCLDAGAHGVAGIRLFLS